MNVNVWTKVKCPHCGALNSLAGYDHGFPDKEVTQGKPFIVYCDDEDVKNCGKPFVVTVFATLTTKVQKIGG